MMKKRTVLILLAALVLSLSACEKQPEPAMDTQAPPVLAAPAEASAPEIPAEPESEPEKEWTQADTWVMARSPSACKRMTEPSTTTP